MERNVLEYVDHLHEHFETPCTINSRGRYNVPNNPTEGYRLVTTKLDPNRPDIVIVSFSIEMVQSSIDEFEYPDGTYWAKVLNN